MPLPVPNFAVPGLMEIRSPIMAKSEARWYLDLMAAEGEDFEQDVLLLNKEGEFMDLSQFTLSARLWKGKESEDVLDDFFDTPEALSSGTLALGMAFEGLILEFTTEEGQTFTITAQADNWRVRMKTSAEKIKALDGDFWKWELYAKPPVEGETTYRLQGNFTVVRRAFSDIPA